jgi:hypothetical protein
MFGTCIGFFGWTFKMSIGNTPKGRGDFGKGSMKIIEQKII